jgi:hypothetical protein
MAVKWRLIRAESATAMLVFTVFGNYQAVGWFDSWFVG